MLADRRVPYIIPSLMGRENDIVAMNRGRLVNVPEAAWGDPSPTLRSLRQR